MNQRRTRTPMIGRPDLIPLEALERRVLLSDSSTGGGSGGSGAFRPVEPPGGFAPLNSDLADLKNGPMSNAGGTLTDLYRAYRRFRNGGGADADFEFEVGDGHPLVMKGSSVGMTVRGRNTTLDALVTRLRQSGSELIFRNRRQTVVDAYVPIGQLHDLARDARVHSLNPLFRPVTRQEGVANNQADQGMKVAQVRNNFSLDGSGVTVGVISDSINQFGSRLAGSYATGDLPLGGVNVISDEPGFNNTDEGRAMLELIHDLAPGADLAFAASGVSLQTFADAVRALRQAGSDVIVDDIGFSNEPAFQPGVLDRAITDVTNDGAVYLTAASNNGANGYDDTANFAKIGRDRFIDFRDGPGVDTRLRINDSGGSVTLWWDNPYDGVVGSATTDLDIYFYDLTYGRVVRSATANNIRSGIPMEFTGLATGDYDMEIRVADQVEGTALPTRFRIEMDVLNPGEHAAEFRTTTKGHSGWRDAISVGAVPFFDLSTNESFSSFGPNRYLFDFDGNRLSTPQTFNKPDISGVDNVNTSFFPAPFNSPFGNFSDVPQDSDSLPNFSGTSAAAPNVAAVVALIRQASPDAGFAAVSKALRDTATPLNGASGFDPQGGFGLVDAQAAVQQFITPPTVDIKNVEPDPTVAPVESIKIVFSQRVVGFDLADLSLTRDTPANLLTAGQTVQTTDNGRTYLLRGLSTITDIAGNYTLTLNAAGSGITNTTTLAQPLTTGASDVWTRVNTPQIPEAPSDLKAKVVGDGDVRLRWTDNSTTEDRFVIQRSDNVDFDRNLRTFEVARNVTVFTDETVALPGRSVFYRVRAVSDFSGFQQSSNTVEVFLPAPGDVVLDNESSGGVRIDGFWSATAITPGFLGNSALEDLNEGKGTKQVRFTPNLHKADDYFVYARWTRSGDRATNVPVDIYYGPNRSLKTTLTINQRDTGGDGWVLLGKFAFDAGSNALVRFRTDGTNGVVSVDAVRFLPSSGMS